MSVSIYKFSLAAQSLHRKLIRVFDVLTVHEVYDSGFQCYASNFLSAAFVTLQISNTDTNTH